MLEEQVEFLRCSPAWGEEGFVRCCSHHFRAIDKATGRIVPFELFPGQRRIVSDLFSGHSIINLKARQVGFTSLIAAYMLWNVIFRPMYTAITLAHRKEYAQEFLDRVRFMYSNLPEFLRPQITTDSASLLRLNARNRRVEIRAVVGSESSGRSLTGDLVFIDEAAYVSGLADTIAATKPVLEVARGQMIVASTSDGPVGDFNTLWKETYGDGGELLDERGVGPTGFKPTFINCFERPGRDAVWYLAREKELSALGPVRVRQEYPRTIDEAWEFASGRVYPAFTRERHVGEISDTQDISERYRGIDWGQTESALVCLWVAHIPGPPGLLISKNCPNTIREHMGYRFDPDRPEEPIKKDDHTCDALRYVIVNMRLTGLVWVYREWYVVDSVAKGWTVPKVIRQIHEMSGWQEASPYTRATWEPSRTGELYDGTVADRSWGMMIETMNQMDIPCVGNRRIRGGTSRDDRGVDTAMTERLEGIAAVRMLIEGTERLEKIAQETIEGRSLRILEEDLRAAARFPVTVPLPRRQLHAIARDLLRARRRGRGHDRSSGG